MSIRKYTNSKYEEIIKENRRIFKKLIYIVISEFNSKNDFIYVVFLVERVSLSLIDNDTFFVEIKYIKNVYAQARSPPIIAC